MDDRIADLYGKIMGAAGLDSDERLWYQTGRAPLDNLAAQLGLAVQKVNDHASAVAVELQRTEDAMARLKAGPSMDPQWVTHHANKAREAYERLDLAAAKAMDLAHLYRGFAAEVTQ
jgi:hypothetical protein